MTGNHHPVAPPSDRPAWRVARVFGEALLRTARALPTYVLRTGPRARPVLRDEDTGEWPAPDTSSGA